MAGVKGQNQGNQFAKGNLGGKSINDKRKRAKLRNRLLDVVSDIVNKPVKQMSNEEYDLYKQVVLKMCGNLLPKLQEVTGEDGGDIKIKLVKYGDSNTIPIPTEDISTTSTASNGQWKDESGNSVESEKREG